MTQRPMLSTVLSAVGIVLSGADIFLDPHSDVIMYLLLIVCIAIMIVVALIMARDYNRIATNPVPQFRKTGGNLNGKY